MLLSCVLAGGGCSANEEHYPSPDDQREVMIEVDSASIDTVWTVSGHETTLFGDWRDLGCFTDDDPDSEIPVGVRWTDANEIVIKTTAASAGVVITLKPDGSAGQITQTADDFLVPCPYS